MSKRPSLDEVLSSFAVEAHTDKETLERYMRQYPEYALQLVDLSQELARTSDDEGRLTSDEGDAIGAAWATFSKAVDAPDVFASLSAADLSRIARTLSVPRQVLTAIRERRVTFSTYPKRFLQRLADALGRAVDEVGATLSMPKVVSVRSFRSDDKPAQTGDTISFEQVLRQAGTTDELLAELLADDE